MAYFSGIEMQSSEAFIFTYSGITPEALTQQINSVMLPLRYKDIGQGYYQRGSAAMRFWFGAFHKYFKYSIMIDASNPEQIKVKVRNEVTGFFAKGGLIGSNQASTELTIISNYFKAI